MRSSEDAQVLSGGADQEREGQALRTSPVPRCVEELPLSSRPRSRLWTQPGDPTPASQRAVLSARKRSSHISRDKADYRYLPLATFFLRRLAYFQAMSCMFSPPSLNLGLIFLLHLPHPTKPRCCLEEMRGVVTRKYVGVDGIKEKGETSSLLPMSLSSLSLSLFKIHG